MTPASRSIRPLLAVLLVVAAVAAVFRVRTADLDRMLDTDEADYVRAMRYGLAASYLGLRERSGLTFARDVVDEYRRTGWARPFQRDWEEDDAAGLRHYHPPVGLYPVGMTAALGLDREWGLRLGMLVVGVLACLAAAWLAFVLLDGVASPSVRIWMAATAGLLVATSPYHTTLSVSIGPHAVFSLASAVALVGLTRAVQSPGLGGWVLACAALGVAILTLPYWALLVPAFLWTWWWGQPDRLHRRQRLVWGLVATVGTLLIVWPPFLLSAGLVKPALMYAGIVVKPLVEGRTPGLWLAPFAETHWPIAVLLGLGLIASPVTGRAQWRRLAPTLLFLLGFVLLSLRVGHMKPLYVADALAPLASLAAALAGLAVDRLWRGAALGAAAMAGLVLAAAMPVVARSQPEVSWRPAVAELNDRLAGRGVLVTPRPAGAMVKYYVTGARVVLDSNHPDDLRGLESALTRGDIDTVLRWGGGMEPGGLVARMGAPVEIGGSVTVRNTPVSWWPAGTLAAGPR